MAVLKYRHPMHDFQALPWWLWPLIVIVVMYVLADCFILISAAIVILALMHSLLTIFAVRQFCKPWTRPTRSMRAL